jgi:purine-cytosine permease-like protein
VAFGLGIVSALMFANAPLYRGPLIGLIGGGDISVYTGFIVSAVAYYLLMRGPLKKTPESTISPAPSDVESVLPGAEAPA